NVYYKFTVENTGDLPLNPVTVTDDTLSLAGCTWVDGDGTTLTAPYALPVADANNNQLMTCVLGPITAVAGLNVNTATATGTNGTNTIDLSSATYATPALTIVKSVAEPYYTAALQVLNYSYVVTNSGSAPLLGPVTVADDKTTVTCPAVSTAIQTAPPGPGDGDNWLDVGESITCAATYIVTGGDVATGTITNTASATADGVTSANVTTTIGTPADLAVAKTNNVSGSVPLGTPFIWTLTVSNGGNTAATFTAGQTILSDLLPVGPTYGTPTPGTFVNITNTGNISCNVTAGTLACTANGGS